MTFEEARKTIKNHCRLLADIKSRDSLILSNNQVRVVLDIEDALICLTKSVKNSAIPLADYEKEQRSQTITGGEITGGGKLNPDGSSRTLSNTSQKHGI